MEKQSRREAVRAYKERRSIPGVFRITCRPTGQHWVGSTPAVDAAQNRVWFGLRTGGQMTKDLQAAWAAHGEAAFDYAVLERNEDKDLGKLGRDMWLKERTAAWLAELDARPLWG